MNKTYRQHRLWWQSSYDRGILYLLEMWPTIISKFPDAELWITYGFDLFDKIAANNPERQQWKAKVVELMKLPGITHFGRVGKTKLKELRQQCGILAYPTDFTEIFMIGAVESQKDGLVPVTMDFAALSETVQSGFKIKGKIQDEAVQKEFLSTLLNLMGDKDLWKKESLKAQKFSTKFYWNKISDKWIEEFNLPTRKPLVTIYTPTLREGWWNLMANNVALQGYKNIEWIIVDDHKDNREKIAQKYAKMYNLNIRYLRGKERSIKRTYSLINANNTALEASKGELFVFLQDFVLMPPDGIEKLVQVHLHHPKDFIAPVDVYYSPKTPPDISNKEDWFNGEIDVAGEFMRANVRINNQGFREAKEVTDFEQNYGAAPTSVLKELGGYWEFFDEALGWDDTEIIHRAKKLGSKLFIDESNVALCIDHWGVLGKDEGGKSVNRTRRLNDPRFIWMIEQMKLGKLPLKRTQEIDNKIDLQYTIPEEIIDDKCVDWMRSHIQEIVKGFNGQISNKI